MKQYVILSLGGLVSISSLGATSCGGDAYIIQQSNMPYTIMQEGHYCLAESVKGQITVKARNVILDLSGRSISQANTPITIKGQSEVLVCNGVIANATNTGIIINDSVNVTLRNLDFIGTNSGTNGGVFVTTSTWTTIDSCTFRNHGSTVVTMQDCESGTLSNSLFSGNNTGIIIALNNTTNMQCTDIEITKNNMQPAMYAGGIVVVNSSHGTFRNCTVSSNSTPITLFYGAFLFSACSNMNVHNCASYNNATPGLCGSFIAMDESSHIIFDACQSSYNQSVGPTGILMAATVGFLLEGSYYSVTNCVVQHNQGSSDSGGIFANNVSNCTFRDNTMMDNVGGVNSYGIYTPSGTGGMIWSNVAQGHVMNFQGTMPKVTYSTTGGIFTIYGTTTPTTPTAYDNVAVE